MGFWNGMKRMIQGKPVFQVTDESTTPTSQPVTTVATKKTPLDSRRRKIIPQVVVEHCENHIDGTTMQATAWLTNSSTAEIELDKISVLEQTTELHHRLSAQKGHELQIYDGPVARNPDLHTASLYYKLVSSGDYFRADFMIEYHQEADGVYLIEELHPEQVVHDI